MKLKNWKTTFALRILGPLRVPCWNRESWSPQRAVSPPPPKQPVQPHTARYSPLPRHPAHMSKLCSHLSFYKTDIFWAFHGSRSNISGPRGEVHMSPGCRLRAIWAENSGFWVCRTRSEGVKSTAGEHIPLLPSPSPPPHWWSSAQ